MRIVGGIAQTLAQRGKRGAHFVDVLLQIAAHRQRGIRLTRSVDQTQGQLALRHGAALPHLARVEADEVGLLAGKRTERGFAALLETLDRIGERREVPLPVHGMRGAR